MKNIADLHVHMHSYDRASGVKLFDQLADSGVSEAAIMSLPKYGCLENLSALRWKLHPHRLKLRAFGGLHQFDKFGEIPPEAQAERLLAMGFDGMKFLDMKPDFRKRVGKGLNDASYDKMFALLEERDVPVLLHVNDPEENWDPTKVSEHAKRVGWFYGDGTHLSKQEIYDEVFALLDRHPKLRVTLAHFFFLSNFRAEAVRVMETYPNVSFDLTPGWEMYLGFSKDIDGWRDFFVKYQDRILFGTDSNTQKTTNDELVGLVDAAITHDTSEFTRHVYGRDILIRGLALPEEIVEKIRSGNYARFVGEMKPTSDAILLAAAEEMYAALKGDAAYESEAAWLKELLAK